MIKIYILCILHLHLNLIFLNFKKIYSIQTIKYELDKLTILYNLFFLFYKEYEKNIDLYIIIFITHDIYM